jgi:hypothetical protein
LRKSLELFDSEGRLPELAWRKAEIKAILELMRELGCEKLNQELKSFATGLEDYWAYYQRAEKIYQELVDRYPREIAQALACGWQLEKQATNNKDYWSRKAIEARSRVLLCLRCEPSTGAIRSHQQASGRGLGCGGQEFLAGRECQLLVATAAGDLSWPSGSGDARTVRVRA